MKWSSWIVRLTQNISTFLEDSELVPNVWDSADFAPSTSDEK